ncbi:MAG: histone deacetylase family protein [Desulfurococcaceae archaeon]|jgi:acetoin utilization deacetylase AcuC-like enzyme|nr:MAG: histone deacetylase family protein [Desulfurococcaceae archaeon]
MTRRIEVIIPSNHALHRPFDQHPERPERIDMILRGLSRRGFETIIKRPTNRPKEVLYTAHDPEYVALIERLSRSRRYIDSDTYVTEHSFQVAIEAVSGSIDAAENIASGSRLEITLPRPPGHHAGRSGSALGAPTQGFCLFNNAALAALRLINMGFEPVAIVDIDIHHGNGTQEIFWEDPRVIHIDLHDSNIYPGTGWYIDIGSGEAMGTKINIPLIAGSRDPEYIYSWLELVEPAIGFFKPRALIISAGFDAHEGEMMGYVKLSSDLYGWLGSRIRYLLEKTPSISGVLVVLEGGYGPGLYEGFPEFINGLLGGDVRNLEAMANRARREHIDMVGSIKRLINKYYKIY